MTTAAEERNGASDVTRARENPPSRKPAEHYWTWAPNVQLHLDIRDGRQKPAGGGRTGPTRWVTVGDVNIDRVGRAVDDGGVGTPSQHRRRTAGYKRVLRKQKCETLISLGILRVCVWLG